jgi:Ureidoglycolate lyase
MKTLRVERLTREAFAPFGDVIELDGARHFPINGGTTERFHDLAHVDVGDQGGRTLINVFRGQPRALPIEITMMERHPLGSQAFIPLAQIRYAIVVAPARVSQRWLAGCQLCERCLAPPVACARSRQRFRGRRSRRRGTELRRVVAAGAVQARARAGRRSDPMIPRGKRVVDR